MANVNITYQEMHDAAKKLRKGQSDITHNLHEMHKFIQHLVNSGYVTDRSSKQFEQSYTEFNSGVTQTVEGLEGIAKFLESAAHTFQQADDDLARGARG
ncbi:WXG100 family type VII secretion target [Streptomyces sp. NPDC096012]|uniref:WXG100 family type VII secretion target n=1 Tax=Streptomyces sp. NPDC096012 TaxID=3155684 RepID=UPI00336A4CA8